MLLMYSEFITPRLLYITNFISRELFEAPIRITTDLAEYKYCEDAKLNYTAIKRSEMEVQIVPNGLLAETAIVPQDISCIEWKGEKAFFKTGGDLPFDLFAASFYLLSRYEEYLPHEKDEYGRYAHTNALAYREKFIDKPLVNIWLNEFRTILKDKFPLLVFKGKQFTNTITYDIDIAYSYLHKGLLRNIGGTIRSMGKGEWRLVLERWLVLLKLKKDPFDCFEWLDALHLYCRVKPLYFFLVAKQTSQYDKNVSTAARPFRELIEYYATHFNAGIHPSWQSGDDVSLLREEIEWLSVVGDKPVHSARMHYLRFTLPVTYRRLLSVGIGRDFSMGYGSINGFRASAASPFNWYDLEREEPTDLVIYPFCFMDSTAFFKKKLSPQKAYKELVSLHETVLKVNGHLITIWHNHLLGADKQTHGWNAMFETFMKEMVYWDAYYDGSY